MDQRPVHTLARRMSKSDAGSIENSEPARLRGLRVLAE
jgi:hypothetical protein